MALLKGLKWRLRSMGPKYVAKEIIRRIAGTPYTYNGILIKDDATFRAIRNLAPKGSVWRRGDTVFFRNKLGIFAVQCKDIRLPFLLVAEDFETLYGYLDVKGKNVADIVSRRDHSFICADGRTLYPSLRATILRIRKI
jgi:hypothetical protein